MSAPRRSPYTGGASCPRRYQCGQALVLGLLVLAASAVLVLLAYNVSQLSAGKMRLTQAADNAAYGGAVFNARILNYAAYLNRAMIVNHVTAAQAVTASSYLAYQSRNTHTLCLAFCNVPYIGQLIGATRHAVHAAERQVAVAAPVVIGLTDVTNLALQTAQQALWLTGSAELPRVIERTARANLPASRPSAALQQLNRASYLDWIRLYRGEAERWRLADAVEQARDRWTRERSHDGLQWLRALLPLPLLIRDFRFTRRGGTELSDLGRWEATDTLSIRYKTLRRLRWRDGERLPLGWASRSAGAGQQRRDDRAFGGSARTNPRATRFAWHEQQPVRHQMRGIGPFIDLAHTRRAQALPVLVELQVPERFTGTTNQRNSRLQAGSGLRGQDMLANDRLASIARAEARFEPPGPRQDQLQELASTFSPWWTARLTSPSREERLLADAAAGRGSMSFSWLY